MANIYQLTNELLELEDMMDTEENIDAYFDTYEAVDGEFEIKCEGYGKLCINIDALIESLEKEIERLKKRVTTLKNNKKRLQDRVKSAMEITGKLKFQSGIFKFSVAKNGGKQPMVIIEDSVPEEYKKVEYVIDKEKIREKLESGELLEFATLEERGTHLSIR